MIFSTSQNSIKKMLKKFYEPKSYLLTSMSDQLQKIVRWLGHYSNNERVEVEKLMGEIERMLVKNEYEKKNVSNPYWLVAFKSMLLIEELLTIGVVGSTFQATLEAINQALEHIEQQNLREIQTLKTQLSKKPTSTNLLNKQKCSLFDQQVIYSKLLKPYHNYLRKRCQLLPKTFSPKTICYYLINLLASACACNEVIYLFGRYNKLDEFFIIGEFNFILAKDCSLLYSLMRECVDFQQLQHPRNSQGNCSIHKQSTAFSKSNNDNNNNSKLPISEIDDILQQTHQKLYHIFYNKYNYKRIEHYGPQWINLDHCESKSLLNKSHYNKPIILKSEFDNENEHIALDETACSVATSANKQQHVKNKPKLFNSSQIIHSSQNNSMTKELRQQSIEVIHDLQQFLQKFDQTI